jgi:hypothetical protein
LPVYRSVISSYLLHEQPGNIAFIWVQPDTDGRPSAIFLIMSLNLRIQLFDPNQVEREGLKQMNEHLKNELRSGFQETSTLEIEIPLGLWFGAGNSGNFHVNSTTNVSTKQY